MKIRPVILCGGAGTRLWEDKKHHQPKQFIDFGGWNLMEKTLERIKNPIFDYPIISTNNKYLSQVRRSLKNAKIKKFKIVLEPAKKNTAPAILSSALIKDIPLKQSLMYFAADHLIEKTSIFNRSIKNNVKNLNDKNIFIFGIKPTNPSSEYGYFLTKKIKNINKVSKFIEKPNLEKITEIFKLGFPIGACIFVEFGLFSGSGLLLSNLGEQTIAAHSIAMQVTTVTFMLPLSVGLAAAVRTGNLLGAGDFIGARYSSFFAIIVAVSLASFNFLALIFYGDYFASFFNADKSIVALSSSLLFIAAFMQLSDGISFTGQGALRGYKDTLAPMYIMILAFWFFGLPIGYSLGLTDVFLPALGAYGMWIGMCCGVILASILVFFRLDKTTKKAIGDKNFKVF